MKTSFIPLLAFTATIVCVSSTSSTAAETSTGTLRSALLLHASFDKGLDADFAVGDPKLYTAASGNRKTAQPGLPEGSLVVHAKGEGKHGDALHFTKKMRPVVFFRGDKNLGYTTNNWSGSVSVWLRLDPDKDLEPGYCDPLQFVAQDWNQGNMFIEFSKDHTPRHFRYAIQAVTKYWNPKNLGWEAIPDADRPMVPVLKPPFKHNEWTHVVFTFGNANTGKKDGWGKLYLNGKYQGEFTGFQNTFNWEVSQSALTLGLSYIGWLDELAVFNRPLSEQDTKAIYEAARGLTSIE